MKEEMKKLLEDCECTGSRCPHEISGKHYVMIPEDVDSIIDLAVSKERERIVEMIEKEIDRIKNGDIKWVGLRKALKLIQNERTI